MIVALYILIVLVAVGAVLYTFHRMNSHNQITPDDQPHETEQNTAEEKECCGMHITCEKDSLLTSVSNGIEYYDDEELDRFKGRDADDYTAEETEEFRNVLLTLLPHDIAGWGRSIQLRGITLPTPVRDELLMIVAEARKGASAT